MQNNQAIFESLFNRNFADNQHTAFLEEMTNRHPYFSPAQFFLLQQVQDNAAAFEQQAVKTNIFFNNAHWLNFQLKQTNMPVEETLMMPAAVIAEPEPVVETENAPPAEIVITEAAIAAVEKEIEPVVEPEPVIVETVNDATTEIVIPEAAIPAVEKEIEPAVEPEPVIVEMSNKDPEPVLAIVDDLPDNTDAPEPIDQEEEKEIEPMHISLKMPEEKTNLSEAMLFEPMHMVDYFASQGIKLSEDVQTGDKLGKQLKSFTEWLKTMKKVHVPDGAEKAVNTDSSIQVLAENSNTEAEVLTESMAEVFARQGKVGKAAEVYEKLSLLNPAKSTYFAAKIDNLKGL